MRHRRSRPRRAAALRVLAGSLAAWLLASTAGCGEAALPTTTTLPAEPGVPAAEVGAPPDGVQPRGVVLLVHGGGWVGPKPELTAAQRPAAAALRRAGYATVIVDYRSGRRGLQDLLLRFDQTRRAFLGLPVCLFGQSAGGHLALLVAARRTDVACVVSQAGPTDLAALRTQARGVPSYRWAVDAFGRDALDRFSPVARAAAIRARVLQVAARNDRYVPPAQAIELDRRLRRGRLILLPAGATPFVHSDVDAAAAADAVAAQQEFLDEAMPALG